MKKILSIFVTLLIAISLFGQNTNWEEVVYLKDGSIIRGTIIEQIPGKSIKIQTKDRNVFSYNMDQVEKITKEEIPYDKNIKNKNNEGSITKFSNITEVGGIFAFGKTTKKFEPFYIGGQSTNYLKTENKINQFSLTTINGCQINRTIFFGVGIGTELGKYSINVPFFADLRYYILKSKLTPSIEIGGGYALYWTRPSITSDFTFSGGALGYSLAGIRLYLSNNISWTLGVGYQLQFNHSNLTFTNNTGQTIATTKTNNYSHFIMVKTGIIF